MDPLQEFWAAADVVGGFSDSPSASYLHLLYLVSAIMHHLTDKAKIGGCLNTQVE